MHYKQPDPPQTVDYSLKSILSWPTVVRRRNDRKTLSEDTQDRVASVI